MPPPTRLLLVRHGESTWNAEHRLQGQADPPLSERGRAQTAALRPLIERLPIEHVVSSDLVRAVETAALLGHPEAPRDPGWREVDVGEWSGRRAVELDPEHLRAWREGDAEAPGGETRADFASRVAAAVDELAGRGGFWLVVTHGGCVRAACAHVTSGGVDRFGPIPNASATLVELGARPRLGVLSWVPDPLAAARATTDLASA